MGFGKIWAGAWLCLASFATAAPDTYSLLASRKPASSQTALNDISFSDGDYRISAKKGEGISNSDAAIQISFSHSAFINLANLHFIDANAIDGTPVTVLDMAGDTLSSDDVLSFNNGQTQIQVQAEDGTKKTYKLQITRKPASTEALLKVLILCNLEGNCTRGNVSALADHQGTVHVAMPLDADLSSLMQGSYGLSEMAELDLSSPSSDSMGYRFFDLTTAGSGLTLTVTAEDQTTTSTYTVKAELALLEVNELSLCDAKENCGFAYWGTPKGAIHQATATKDGVITIIVPYNTDLGAMRLEKFYPSNYTVSLDEGVYYDFRSPKTITVSTSDGVSASYVVTVVAQGPSLEYLVVCDANDHCAKATIDSTTATLKMPDQSDLSALYVYDIGYSQGATLYTSPTNTKVFDLSADGTGLTITLLSEYYGTHKYKVQASRDSSHGAPDDSLDETPVIPVQPKPPVAHDDWRSALSHATHGVAILSDAKGRTLLRLQLPASESAVEQKVNTTAGIQWLRVDGQSWKMSPLQR